VENTAYSKRRQDGDCRIYYKQQKKISFIEYMMHGESKVQKYTSLCLLLVSASGGVSERSL